MSEPLVLVILLTSAGTADPTTDAMMAATRKALGPEAVVLADMSMPATNKDALSLATKVGARAIVRVTWADASQTSARLHVHVAPAPPEEWSDDEILFVPRDAPAEKGRTVGYTLATMVQRIERDRAAVATAGTSTGSSSPASASSPPPLGTDPNAASPASGAAAKRDALTTTTPPSSSSSAPVESGDFDLFATATGALGGAASSLGGGGGGRFWPTSHIGIRLAVLARLGSIESASSGDTTSISSTTLGAALGPGFRFKPLGSSVEVGARTDLLVFHHSAQRTGLTRTRFVGGFDLVLEGAWLLSPSLALIAGFGAEVAFGTTAVNVGAARVAEFPTVRGIAEVGGRFRF